MSQWHFGTLNFVYSPLGITSGDFVARYERPNACAQKPKARPHDGQPNLTKQQAFMRQTYAEIAERGVGLLQRFVRQFHTTTDCKIE